MINVLFLHQLIRNYRPILITYQLFIIITSFQYQLIMNYILNEPHIILRQLIIDYMSIHHLIFPKSIGNAFISNDYYVVSISIDNGLHIQCLSYYFYTNCKPMSTNQNVSSLKRKHENVVGFATIERFVSFSSLEFRR